MATRRSIASACSVSASANAACPRRRQTNDVTAPIGRRRFAFDEAVGDKPGQDAAQIPGIQVELAAQIRHGLLVAVRQLEQHPSLGQPEGGARQLGPQQPKDAGVEAVELSNLRQGGHRHS